MTDQTSEQPTTEQPTNAQPATGTAPGQQAGDTKPVEKTFTQAEVNAMIRTRIQEKEAEVLKKYGDPKEAKAALQRLKELEDAGKTEVQRLTDQFTDAETKRAIAESGWQRAALDNAVILAVGKAGVPADRWQAAIKLFDADTVKVGEGGTFEGLDAAVEKLLKDNPFLKAEPAKPAPGGAALSPTNPAGAGQGQYDLSWFKPAGQSSTFLRGGGVRPPGEDNK